MKGLLRFVMPRVAMLAFAGFGMPMPSAAAPPSLSVLTYNVHGLPWPLTTGRGAAFARISGRLMALRRQGTQPHVVVLQEAFTSAAKRIGRDSGYRYVATGPSADAISPLAMTADDRRFAASARWSKGETEGKFVDSGLQILSDYPIISVRSTPFPHFACAGFDCLANKGVMIVRIRVPGLAVPVAVATTHLNSRGNSGVGDARSYQAYDREVGILGAFLTANWDVRDPMVFAGDFNVGEALKRRQALLGMRLTNDKPMARVAIQDALHSCAQREKLGLTRMDGDAHRALDRARDWQFFRSGSMAAIAANAIRVPFGLEPDRSMLSDHIGYTAIYRLFARHPMVRLSA